MLLSVYQQRVSGLVLAWVGVVSFATLLPLAFVDVDKTVQGADLSLSASSTTSSTVAVFELACSGAVPLVEVAGVASPEIVVVVLSGVVMVVSPEVVVAVFLEILPLTTSVW